MTPTLARRFAVGIGGTLVAAMVLGIVVFGLIRLWPRHDETPVKVAHADEKTATAAAGAVGTQLQRQNDDATIHIDLTTKDIRDAFSTIPAPAPSALAGGEPRALPAAPVDRLRDRLNEGIARANRAAGPAGTAD